MNKSKSLRILLVEDEPLVAMMITDMAEDAGHKVVATAARLAEALPVASEGEIDVAILDVNLNGERTFPVAEALRARGVPVIFSTGYGAESLGLDWAHSLVLAKPFQPHDLERVLDAAGA
jgi:DNA-binding response OmpR family regulator